jgi:N,N-dimethylformamidase beta subunit-like, C-terminal
VLTSRVRGLHLQVFRSGPERRQTRSNMTMKGVPVTPRSRIGSRPAGAVVEVLVGAWPSGLYFARVQADGGGVGFAPFVVRPSRLGEHDVAVVMPTLTWQAYNRRDEDGDGIGDSWYADWSRTTVRLGRPHLNRGVPAAFRRYDLPFLRWLAQSRREVDVLAQSDLEAAPSPRLLERAYRLIVFPGHHEYVTQREYDVIEGYRNLGGNLMFLSADNFYWRVVRGGRLMTKTKPWRRLGRPEASLIGVQYRASAKVAPRGTWVIRPSSAHSWLFADTPFAIGSHFGAGGIEVDSTSAASPRGTEVVAEIPNVFGRGITAQMTYYETPRGAKVFAAGAFYFTRLVDVRPLMSQVLQNLWQHLEVD